jgi:hypothetical protein
MTLARMPIEDRPHPQPAAAHGGVADEVPSPDMPTVRGFLVAKGFP